MFNIGQEKWDSITRRWRDNTSLVQKVQLFLIDEVHLLNDETRGATMEVGTVWNSAKFLPIAYLG